MLGTSNYPGSYLSVNSFSLARPFGTQTANPIGWELEVVLQTQLDHLIVARIEGQATR